MNKRKKTRLVIVFVVLLTVIAFVICFVVDMKLSNIRAQNDMELFNSNMEKFNSDIKNITKIEVYESNDQSEVIKVIEEEEVIDSIIDALENGKYYKIANNAPGDVTTGTDHFHRYYFKFLINNKALDSASYRYNSKELIFSGFRYKVESLVFDEILKPLIIEKRDNLLLVFESFLDKNEEYKKIVEFYEITQDYTLRIKYKMNLSQDEIMEMVENVSKEIPEINSFVQVEKTE